MLPQRFRLVNNNNENSHSHSHIHMQTSLSNARIYDGLARRHQPNSGREKDESM